MMKIIKGFLSILFTVIILASITSCSSSNNNEQFQTNDPSYDGFKLFNIFDGYPTISDAWSKVQSHVFNEGMRQLIADTPTDRLKHVIGLMDDLVSKSTEPIFLTLEALQVIMGRIVHQDSLDAEGGTTTYYADFISFMDKLSDSNANFSDNLMPIIEKLLVYINRVHAGDINTITDNLLYALQEETNDFNGTGRTDNQNLKNMLPMIQEALVKLLIRNNDYMYLDGSGDLITDGTVGPTNTELGNAVEGIDKLLSGLNAVASQDPAVTDYLTDMLLEVGKATGYTANGNLFREVVRDLINNIRDYYTVGGLNYGLAAVNNDYHHQDDTVTFTPRSGGASVTARMYVNAELTNSVRELWPVLQLLFVRSNKPTDTKPDCSILKDDAGISPLAVIGKSLGQLRTAGIDFNTYTLENTLKQMIDYNGAGAERQEYDITYLEHLLFTISVASNFGYKTLLDDTHDPYENHGRGHGQSTKGIMTLNDSMYSLRSLDFISFDAYNLALDKRITQADFIGRSSDTQFNGAGIASHKFYLGYDYPAFCLLPSAAAGDTGIPNGGESAITPSTNTTGTDETLNDYRTYFPKVANGLGELNTAAVMMGMIARICWEGEGPYYSTQGGTQAGNVYTYYRPDGSIYAQVTKVVAGNPSTWTYSYPVDATCKIDVVDPNDATQRWNRYRESMQSDYYLVKAGFSSSYCSPPINSVNTGTNLVMGATGANKFKMKADAANVAQRFVLWEKVPEKSLSRECATQEQAMFRNFQWLMNEKKIAFVIPMWIETAGSDSASFIVIEANGLAGLKGATKGYDPADPNDPAKGNGCWLKWAQSHTSDPEGLTNLDATELTRRGWQVNYGDSGELGDSRILIFAREHNLVNVDLIFTNIIGRGHVLPDVIGQNFDPVPRMGFLVNDHANGLYDGTEIASGSTIIGNASNPTWQNRSRLMPLVVAAVGNLHERSYYKTASSGYNYNYADKALHKSPLKTILSGLIPPLVKPWMWRLQENVASPTWVRWAPRIKISINGLGVEGDDAAAPFDYLSPAVAWDGSDWVSTNKDMRPRKGIRTLVGILTENLEGGKLAYRNGLLPLLVQTNTVSKLMALLQRMESGTVTQATRDKIYEGLEQVISSLKGSYGDIVRRELEYNTGTGAWGEDRKTTASYGDDFYTQVDFSKIQFLFFDYIFGTSTPKWIRPVDLNGDILLAEAIGFQDVINKVVPADPSTWTLTTPGKGIIGLVDRRRKDTDANQYYEENVPLPDGQHWYWDLTETDRNTNFDDIMNGITSLLSDVGPTGDSYYIMNDVTALVNKFLTRVTFTDDAERESQFKALRHTLAILLAEYDGSAWVYSDELTSILTIYLPDIITTFGPTLEFPTGHYDDLMIVAYNLFKPAGIMPSIFHGLSTSHSWSDVFTELDLLLNDDFFVNRFANPSFWIGKNSITELLTDMVDMIGEDWYTKLVFSGPASSVSPFDILSPEEAELLEFNPYKTLGLIMSVGGR